MLSSNSIIVSLLIPALALCVPTKRAPCSFNAPGAGTFTNHATYSFDGSSLPAGLYPNTDSVGGTPFARTYDPSLVSVSGGYLNLKVPGGQSSSPIRGAGVNTAANNILYASVRTQAIFSTVPGTVQSKSPAYTHFPNQEVPTSTHPSKALCLGVPSIDPSLISKPPQAPSSTNLTPPKSTSNTSPTPPPPPTPAPPPSTTPTMAAPSPPRMASTRETR
jgi:hypothetical protein